MAIELMTPENPEVVASSGVLASFADLPIGQIDAAAVKAHHIVGFESRNLEARPFNLLRTQVAKKCEQSEWSLIGLTSAEPGAGKSFVALNLAAALSRIGKRPVYLFDFDFSRASIAKAFGVEPAIGLSDFLSGRVDNLDGIGWRVEGTGLAVFPTARTESSSAPLLSGPRFKALIDMIRSRSEPSLIICDLPPAFANDDAMIAVQHLDAYLLVVESGKTTKSQLADTVAMLDPAPRLGTVLNRYDGGFADPYGYGAYSSNYSKYY